MSAGKHAYFGDIVDAVLHVHQAHGVLGGSQILMLGKSPPWSDYCNSFFSCSQTLTEC